MVLVCGCDGYFEFNVMIFLIVYLFYEVIYCFLNGVCVFVDWCVSGIEVDVVCCCELVDWLFMFVIVLNLYIGYDVVVVVVKEVFVKNKILCEVVFERGFFDVVMFDCVFDLVVMIWLGEGLFVGGG